MHMYIQAFTQKMGFGARSSGCSCGTFSTCQFRTSSGLPFRQGPWTWGPLSSCQLAKQLSQKLSGKSAWEGGPRSYRRCLQNGGASCAAESIGTVTVRSPPPPPPPPPALLLHVHVSSLFLAYAEHRGGICCISIAAVNQPPPPPLGCLSILHGRPKKL